MTALGADELSGSTRCVLDRLLAAVDELTAIDPAELPDTVLADTMVALRGVLDRQEAVFARLVHAGHVRGVGSVDGAASIAAWLRHRTGMREGGGVRADL